MMTDVIQIVSTGVATLLLYKAAIIAGGKGLIVYRNLRRSWMRFPIELEVDGEVIASLRHPLRHDELKYGDVFLRLRMAYGERKALWLLRRIHSLEPNWNWKRPAIRIKLTGKEWERMRRKRVTPRNVNAANARPDPP
jgi:hypothetical protein